MLTILWHDSESAGYTDQIELDWLRTEGVRKGVLHRVLGPRSGSYEAKCDISVSGHIVDLDYKRYEEFNAERGMLIGVMRVQFASTAREQISQVLWKSKGERRFVPCSTTATLTADSRLDFDHLVEESSKLTSEERRRRLAGARKRPLRAHVVSTVFVRNQDVVAEVLFRANGHCEVCRKSAPFKRANGGAPYLEVHHKRRLADGGNDTLDNALAVCPNCHREAHYGETSQSFALDL